MSKVYGLFAVTSTLNTTKAKILILEAQQVVLISLCM